MIGLSRNLKIFSLLLTIYTILFRFFLSDSLTKQHFSDIWLIAVIYSAAIFITAFTLGATEKPRKSRAHLAFMYHFVTYIICNIIALLWHAFKFNSPYEKIHIVLITAAAWGAGLFLHYLLGRNSIKGIRKGEIFD